MRNLNYHRLRILDVGSGPISVFEPFAPADCHLVPYDSLASEYNRLIPNKKFPIRTQLPDERFDVISFLNCLDHMDDPQGLLNDVRERLADDGRVWIFVNIDQPYDAMLHPQDFKFWQLPPLVQRFFEIQDCGLVREGVLFPYAWWAVCGRLRKSFGFRPKNVWWVAKCAAIYARFQAARAVRKAARVLRLE